ncbi:MAG: hypothetical protein V4636_19950 [Pseudomonadota bacterium]
MKPVLTIYEADNGWIIDIAAPTATDQPRTYINDDKNWIANAALVAMTQAEAPAVPPAGEEQQV